MKKTKVICVGEALIDRIKNKSNEDFTDYFGGAPANVACALKKLNTESVFIGCLGRDEFAKKFIKLFKELDVNINFLQLDSNHPTRIVRVNRDCFGERVFSGFVGSSETIYADENLKINSIQNLNKCLEKLFFETKYFVVGTVLLSSAIAAESIYYLLNLANQSDVKVIIDLNWREVFWDHSTFSAEVSKKERINIIKSFLNYAHILKLSKEEASLFFENTDPCSISQKILSKPDVIITDGGNPILWFINGFQGKTNVANSFEIIDTTGAGDAFLAGYISQLVSFNCPNNEEDIQKYLTFASICGLLTCIGKGAIEAQPDYEKVTEFLVSQIL